MKVLFVLCSILILAACGNSEEPEVIDLEDVLPSSERYAERDSVKVQVPKVMYYDSLPDLVKRLSDTLGINKETIDSIPEIWFPDRFQNVSAEKWIGRIGKAVGQAAIFSFKDSLGMKNTLFNWLDSFGKKRNSLMLFEEKKLIPNAFVLYATERNLVYFESDGRILEKELLKNLKNMFPKEEILYVITQNVNDKTVWWTLEEKKWTKIEKVEL